MWFGADALCAKIEVRVNKSLLATAVVLAVTPVHGFGQHEWYSALMPPPKYDVPYTGELTIWITSRPVKEWCSAANDKTVACAMPGKGECRIWVPKAVVEGKPFNLIFDGATRRTTEKLAIALRHELAHCNGWGKDHGGGRKVPVDDASVKMPEFPPSTRWLSPDPPVVCITPDRTVEDCKTRRPFWAESQTNVWQQFLPEIAVKRK